MAFSIALQRFLRGQSGKEIPLTANEALSGIFGTISLVSWIFVFVPQLIENYKQKSAAGVSLLFLFIWFVGDATNLAGAIWAELVPTVIAIAIYYVFSDIVIATQCVYYNILNAREERRRRALSSDTTHTEATEDQPLLSRRDSSQSIGLPGSHVRRRSSAARSTRTQDSTTNSGVNGTLTKIAEEEALQNGYSTKMEWIKNAVSILAICIIGAGAWAICWKVGLWKPTPAPGDNTPDKGEHGNSGKKSTPVGAEILGYISAFLYLAARVPQILKNWREQSCEGLSLLFFMLSLMGNLAYGASILFHSVEREYVITNMPWLIGSLGTMAEDVTIFVQFRLYGEGSAATAESSAAVE